MNIAIQRENLTHRSPITNGIEASVNQIIASDKAELGAER